MTPDALNEAQRLARGQIAIQQEELEALLTRLTALEQRFDTN